MFGMKAYSLPRGLFLLILLLSQTPVYGDIEITTEFDRWYVLEMAGEHAGYMHLAIRKKDDRYVTQTDLKLTVNRGDVPMEVEMNMWFIETADGKPIEASSSLKPGALAIVNHVVFKDDHVEITTGRGAAAHTTQSPLPDPAYLPPYAAQKHAEQCIAEGQTEIHTRTLDASMGITPIDIHARIIGEENVEVYGKTVPAIAWEASLSTMPGMKVREYVDEQGRMIKSSMLLIPGMDITIIEADEQLAKAKVDPPELMVQTLIKPDKPIENARQSRSAIYKVTIQDAPGNLDDVSLNLPRCGYQRVVWDDQSTAAVIVDLDQPINAIDDLPTDADLGRSNMIDHDSPAVQALLDKALADLPEDATDHQVAGRLRRFVNDFIDEKDLSVGLASAGQIARTAQGDCTEHGVLLAALLRAKGIPARTVTGLIYVDEFLGQDGVFGYHMWTQAWIVDDNGGHWIDLDAVLPDHDYDAAHIALNVSSMADGQMVNDLIEMLPAFGRLKIEITDAK